MKKHNLSLSLALVGGMALLFVPSVVLPMPFEVKFTFPGGHIQRLSQGWDYYFTPPSLDKSVAGNKITIKDITVSAIGKSDGTTINWDWEVHLGPTPFGLPVGQLRNTSVGPVSGYQKVAPTQLQFVIGSYSAPPGDYNFSGTYDYTKGIITAKPQLSWLKNATMTPMDLKEGLYAQLFLWTGDPRNCSITFRDVTLTIRGDIEEPGYICTLSAHAGDDRTVQSGDVVVFDAGGSSCIDKIKKFTWNFDDGDIGDGKEVNHRFSIPKTYKVTLTVEDSIGRSATDIVLITVEKLTLKVGFSEKDKYHITHSAYVTASYYWAGEWANVTEYYVTNLTYNSESVIYSDIAIIQDRNNIITMNPTIINCMWNPFETIYNNTVFEESSGWNVGMSVLGNNFLLLRGFWIPMSITFGPPLIVPEWSCNFEEFSP